MVDEQLLRRMSASPADQRLLTWRDIAATLARTEPRQAPPEARRWAADVAALLKEAGERPFSGDWPREDLYGPSAGTLFYHKSDERFRWPSLVVPPAPPRLYYADTFATSQE